VAGRDEVDWPVVLREAVRDLVIPMNPDREPAALSLVSRAEASPAVEAAILL